MFHFAFVQERIALVELMCDFVEAMNPGLKLQRYEQMTTTCYFESEWNGFWTMFLFLSFVSRRDAEVLKDRDLSGELKDIWGAVQAKREREKDPPANYFSPTHNPNDTIYIEFGPETSQDRRTVQQNYNSLTDDELHHLTSTALNISYDGPNQAPPPSYDAIRHDKIITMPKHDHVDVIDCVAGENGAATPLANAQQVINNGPGDQSSSAISANPLPSGAHSQAQGQGTATTPIPTPSSPAGPAPLAVEENDASPDKTPVETTPNEAITKVPPEPSGPPAPAHKPTSTINDTTKPIEPPTTIEPTTVKLNPAASIPSSTKKEKVGGFLPNSCHNIFPFMKSKLNNDKKQQKDKIIMNSNKDDLQKNNKKSMKLKDEQNKQIELMNSADLKMHNW